MKLGLTLSAEPYSPLFLSQINNSLGELEGRLARVVEASVISGTSTETLEIPHGLKRVPQFVIIQPHAECTWWVSPEAKALWTDQIVVVNFSKPDGTNFDGFVGVLE